jgi:hypothetical protein
MMEMYERDFVLRTRTISVPGQQVLLTRHTTVRKDRGSKSLARDARVASFLSEIMCNLLVIPRIFSMGDGTTRLHVYGM